MPRRLVGATSLSQADSGVLAGLTPHDIRTEGFDPYGYVVKDYEGVPPARARILHQPVGYWDEQKLECLRDGSELGDRVRNLGYVMSEYLATFNNALGMAAPQVGVGDIPLAVMHFGKTGDPAYDPQDPPEVVLNPRILKQSDTYSLLFETCLSLPDVGMLTQFQNGLERQTQGPLGFSRQTFRSRYVLIGAPDWVEVSFTRLNGEYVTTVLHGLSSTLFCHEARHLAGGLITDEGRAVNHPDLQAMGDGPVLGFERYQQLHKQGVIRKIQGDTYNPYEIQGGATRIDLDSLRRNHTTAGRFRNMLQRLATRERRGEFTRVESDDRDV